MPPPDAYAASVSKSKPLKTVNVTARSFDHNHTATVAVDVAWLDGDRHCEAGEAVACLNASGKPRTCHSNTTFPVDVLPYMTTCLASKDAPACGYTAVDPKCDCKQCIANNVKHLVILVVAVHMRRTTAVVAVLAQRRSSNTSQHIPSPSPAKKMQLPFDSCSSCSVVLGIKMDYVLSVPSAAAAISAPKLVS